jgi:Ca-activated chloride channel family protein
MLSTEDFDDDRKDAGEIGAGTDVIALFEFEPTDESVAAAAAHLFDVRIRYKDPGDSKSQLVEFPVAAERRDGNRGSSSDFDFVSAVALFGDYLRNDGDGGRSAVREMLDLAEGSLGSDAGGYRQDFVALLYRLRSAE